jgi:hypothetical protein
MNTNPDILRLIARSGLDESDLLAFIEGELPVERSARLLRELSAHPELREAVFAMRGDRGELETELAADVEAAAVAFDAASIGSVVHQGVTGEFDAEFAARLEASGGGAIPRMRRPRVARSRRMRIPAAAVGTLMAASVAVVFGGLVWLAWPTPVVPSGSQRIADAEIETTPIGDEPSPAVASADLQREAASAGEALSGPADQGVEWAGTTVLASAAEALEAAREGRLVIRIYSPNAQAGRSLVESVTMTASVSRVAVLEGAVDVGAASRIAEAVPVPTGPVFAGDPAGLDVPEVRSGERASWVYMLEVEPTERGISLLVAGLSREPGMLVELLRSDRPVTTPGSADDVSWFREPSRQWTRRIAAPVIVQSGER